MGSPQSADDNAYQQRRRYHLHHRLQRSLSHTSNTHVNGRGVVATQASPLQPSRTTNNVSPPRPDPVTSILGPSGNEAPFPWRRGLDPSPQVRSDSNGRSLEAIGAYKPPGTVLAMLQPVGPGLLARRRRPHSPWRVAANRYAHFAFHRRRTSSFRSRAQFLSHLLFSLCNLIHSLPVGPNPAYHQKSPSPCPTATTGGRPARSFTPFLSVGLD